MRPLPLEEFSFCREACVQMCGGHPERTAVEGPGARVSGTTRAGCPGLRAGLRQAGLGKEGTTSTLIVPGRPPWNPGSTLPTARHGERRWWPHPLLMATNSRGSGLIGT